MNARLCAAAVCALALALPATAAATKPIPDQYIVVLHDGSDATAVAAEHKRKAGAEVLDTYGAALDGYTARLSASELRKVEADPRVDYVTQDAEGVPIAAQTMPAGINRIDADVSTTLAGDGSGTTAGDVAVYDTGIQTNHPDLNVAGGVNCLSPTDTYHDKTIGDQHGHGTHIAGTIGAKDDANGVVGVAPGVRLWSVRVLNRLASGSTSTQLCGIDWMTANGPSLGIKVVNSSMRMFTNVDDGNCGLSNNDVLHQAICRSTAAGIVWVFAAGNTGADFVNLNGPNYNEVLTVAAIGDNNGTPNVGSTATFTCTPATTSTKRQKPYAAETDDKHTSFSSFAVRADDQAHTIAAPGACVYSTYLNSGYGHMSGTSMAAPHVAGVAHLCVLSGLCTGTTAEIIQKLRADAAAYTQANPGWGFTGDPLRPVTGRYYGYLARAGLY
jgi:subtilisin